ncbi:four helix bundle protein [Gaoshiqia sediminis]|uniref:Four helix bundle protein n=1 Tax=Gaoshiqia sediminis TaxID=2986998 RepID=A0AA42C8F1_9BACT|nr:four helix bundle protein [Gaoshiqia sediminis]MCW0482656.1 four helix bundle protein [Gaoshiqia sediminis]
MHNYSELKIWQEARKLVKEVYSLTAGFPKEEMYGLTSQIRRAVVSIPSNIAEGTGRSSDKEFQRFLDYAIGSLFELETQIILSNDLNFISAENYETVCLDIKSLIRMIVKFKGVLVV